MKLKSPVIQTVLVASLGMLFSGCAKEPATPFVPITPQTRTGSPPVDTAIFPSVGSTEFLSANENEQLSAGTGGNYSGNRGVAGNAELDDAAGAAPRLPL